MKRIIKDYFTFSKKERTAISILLLLIACFIVAPYVYPVKPRPPVINKALADFLSANKTIVADSNDASENASSYHSITEPVTVKRELFLFDPNTISEEEWKRLGIKDKTIHTIINYRNKGGKFRIPEDVRKIWGIKKEEADRLIPFVKIAETASTNHIENTTGNRKPEMKKTEAHPIDINTATTDDFKNLPGLNESLANRIITYRERINGFISIEQIHKTYGISDSVFALISTYLLINTATQPKVNLNTASAYELKMRLNIPDAIAKAIVVYRQQYGQYQSVTDLKKIVFISDSLFQRISPVLKVE